MPANKMIPSGNSPLPYFEVGVSAGFPSPADDSLERPLDLHELLVEHPAATFFVRAIGESMVGAGIQSGDMLIVDRSISAESGAIIVALLGGEFTVKRLLQKGGHVQLVAEHPHYPPIEVTEDTEFQVWGVVTYVIHRAH